MGVSQVPTSALVGVTLSNAGSGVAVAVGRGVAVLVGGGVAVNTAVDFGVGLAAPGAPGDGVVPGVFSLGVVVRDVPSAVTLGCP